MRCRACEVLSLTSAQYCECCGGRLTERDHSARSSAAAAPAGDAEAKASETPSGDEESLWSQLMTTPAPPSPDSFGVPPVPVPPPQIPEAAKTPVEVVVLPAARPVTPAPHAEVVTIEEVRPPVVPSQQPVRAAARAQAPTRPVPVDRRSNVTAASSSSGGGYRVMVLAAAVVVAAASCAAVFWLRSRQEPATAHVEDATSPAVGESVDRQPAAPVIAVAPESASTRPKRSMRQIAVSTRKTPIEASSSAAASAAVGDVAAVSAPPPPTSPTPAAGPFFDTTDVNEAPRVETRVEPELPEQLRDRSIREIVIVRVLISQNGHPSRISLLRRSRSGTDLDNAVIAAVNRWTFAPARKRGEAVSCWLNLGVPIGRTD